jgi:hypothetical protein
MSEFEDRNVVATETDTDRDVVIVEDVKEVRRRRDPWSVLPILLGVLFLLANVWIFRQVPLAFTSKNKDGAIALMMILASVVICLALIVYGIAARRDDDDGSLDQRTRFRRSVVVPLLLGVLAPVLTVWGLNNYRAADQVYLRTTGKPCLEIYATAANVAKDNPRFRMPASDPDEVRCAVNAAIGR